MVLHRTLFISLLLLLLIPTNPAIAERLTPDEYWKAIREIASKEYKGKDFNPTITSRYQFQGDYKGAGVGLNMDIPLWNKKKYLEQRNEVVSFLRTGASLVMQLESCIFNLHVLIQKRAFLKAIMKDEGIGGIDAFFKNEQDIIKQKALETQYHRELHSLINPLSKKPVIYTSFSDTDKDKKDGKALAK